MPGKSRLGLYLEDEDIKKTIKMAAAKKGVSTTVYCAQAIKERLEREGELRGRGLDQKKAYLARIDALSRKIGPVGLSASELIADGRRR